MADFADRIRLYRSMHDMTLEDLATKLHTQKQVIHRYESRQQIPKLDKVAEYAVIMNVSVPWLIGYDDGGPESENAPKAELCKIVDQLSEEQINAMISIAKTMTPPEKRTLHSVI